MSSTPPKLCLERKSNSGCAGRQSKEPLGAASTPEAQHGNDKFLDHKGNISLRVFQIEPTLGFAFYLGLDRHAAQTECNPKEMGAAEVARAFVTILSMFFATNHR
jgi:hypothetical protein